jgi:hypothetical protein
MKTKILSMGRRLWIRENAPHERANLRKWARSIRFLGDKWVFAQYVGRR